MSSHWGLVSNVFSHFLIPAASVVRVAKQDPAPAAEARKHFSNAISELEALPPSYRTLYMSQMIAQLEKAMYDMET